MLKGPDMFDNEETTGHLLGFENGVLNLWTGDFSSYSKDVLLTTSTGHSYDESYELPVEITEALEKIRDEPGGEDEKPSDNGVYVTNELFHAYRSAYFMDSELMYYLVFQAASAVGQKKEYWVLNHGHGSNFKSTDFTHKMYFLGSQYCMVASPSLLDRSEGKGNAANGELVRCHKTPRVIISDEPGRIDGGQLKSLTGGAIITARDLYKSEVAVKINALIQINSQHMISIKEFKLQNAIVRRYGYLWNRVTFVDDVAKVRDQYRKQGWDETCVLKSNPKFKREEWMSKHTQTYFRILLWTTKHIYEKYSGNVVKCCQDKFRRCWKMGEEFNRRLNDSEDVCKVFEENFRSIKKVLDDEGYYDEKVDENTEYEISENFHRDKYGNIDLVKCFALPLEEVIHYITSKSLNRRFIRQLNKEEVKQWLKSMFVVEEKRSSALVFHKDIPKTDGVPSVFEFNKLVDEQLRILGCNHKSSKNVVYGIMVKRPKDMEKENR
jgi:hypothetical protein